MKTSTLRSLSPALVGLSAVAVAAGLVGCTIITPASPDAGTKTKVVVIKQPARPDALPPPKPLQADVLYVVNLERSEANLDTQYAQIITGLGARWLSRGLQIANMGLISTYADPLGPRLLLGQSSTSTTPPLTLATLLAAAQSVDGGTSNPAALLPILGPSLGNVDNSVIALALQMLAGSGKFDPGSETSEAKNVIEFGRGLNVASLPPQLGGIDRSAFFDVPHDLFIVVYLQPLPRRCAIGTDACNVDGRSPTDIFTETDGNGNAAWLAFTNGGIPPAQVVQLSVATSEMQSSAVFEAACKAVPGFPAADIDIIGPSSNAFFTPLMSALNAAHAGTGHSGDFCTLVGSGDPATNALNALADSVAALAASH